MSGTHEDLLMRAVLAGRFLGYDDTDDDACLISLSLAPHGAHQDRVPPSLLACPPGLPACLPASPPACLTSATDSLAWGGSGETGLVGCLVMEGGASQVDQETRAQCIGVPALRSGAAPPFSEWGYVPRVFSAPVLPRKSWGVPPMHLPYSASRIPYGPS